MSRQARQRSRNARCVLVNCEYLAVLEDLEGINFEFRIWKGRSRSKFTALAWPGIQGIVLTLEVSRVSNLLLTSSGATHVAVSGTGPVTTEGDIENDLMIME